MRKDTAVRLQCLDCGAVRYGGRERFSEGSSCPQCHSAEIFLQELDLKNGVPAKAGSGRAAAPVAVSGSWRRPALAAMVAALVVGGGAVWFAQHRIEQALGSWRAREQARQGQQQQEAYRLNAEYAEKLQQALDTGNLQTRRKQVAQLLTETRQSPSLLPVRAEIEAVLVETVAAVHRAREKKLTALQEEKIRELEDQIRLVTEQSTRLEEHARRIEEKARILERLARQREEAAVRLATQARADLTEARQLMAAAKVSGEEARQRQTAAAKREERSAERERETARVEKRARKLLDKSERLAAVTRPRNTQTIIIREPTTRIETYTTYPGYFSFPLGSYSTRSYSYGYPYYGFGLGGYWSHHGYSSSRRHGYSSRRHGYSSSRHHGSSH